MTTTNALIRIVIAEDEDLIRNNLVKKIEGLDPNLQVVYAAQDGRSALQYIQDNSSVDLIVTDIQMPIMDGLELIKSLQSHYPHIRKIITTGYADFEYARQAVRYEASEYLLKPIKLSELQKAISRVQTSIETEKMRYKKNSESLRTQGVVTPEDVVHLVQHYLRENFTRDISLEEISRQFNFTASYLSKIFIKHTGEPPSKYLISLRINEAKYLLTNHRNLSIKEVGENVGYPDQFYFSRVFKQVTGCTPKDFQK